MRSLGVPSAGFQRPWLAPASAAASTKAPAQARPAPPPSDLPAEPAIDPRLLPENVLIVAEKLFAEEQYWDTIQQLEPMLPRAQGDTRARARILLARSYLKNPKWKKRAEGILLELLEENPRNVAACLMLAEMYRDARLPSRARSLYQKVLELQPGHTAAREGLELLEPPPAKVPEPAGGIAGIFRRR